MLKPILQIDFLVYPLQTDEPVISVSLSLPRAISMGTVVENW